MLLEPSRPLGDGDRLGLREERFDFLPARGMGIGGWGLGAGERGSGVRDRGSAFAEATADRSGEPGTVDSDIVRGRPMACELFGSGLRAPGYGKTKGQVFPEARSPKSEAEWFFHKLG